MTERPKIFEYIPHGEDNAISSEELAKLGGFKNVRELRNYIETLRNSGYVICSKSNRGGGYYIHDNSHELKHYVRTVQNRIINSQRSLSSAMRELDLIETTL